MSIRFLDRAKEEGYYELFLLELGTGMRHGEILAQKWGDLNFITGELRINKQLTALHGELLISEPKTKASIRTVILPPSLFQILLEYKKTVDSERIFPSPLDNTCPRTPSAVRKRLQLILERAGCQRVRFHDLRHTFATMAFENGMDVKTLSTTIGHVSSESDDDNPSRDDSSDTTSSESKPTDEDNSDATSSGDGNTTSSETETSSDDTPSGDGSDHSPSVSNPPEDNRNPSTGIAISLVPLVAALAAVTVAAKRKKK